MHTRAGRRQACSPRRCLAFSPSPRPAASSLTRRALLLDRDLVTQSLQAQNDIYGPVLLSSRDLKTASQSTKETFATFEARVTAAAKDATQVSRLNVCG